MKTPFSSSDVRGNQLSPTSFIYIGRPAGGTKASSGRKTPQLPHVLFQFSTTGPMEREESCESFGLLLQTFHEILLHQQSPLSLELGVVGGEVIQAFRTDCEYSRRAIKSALKNVYPTCRLSNQPDDVFGAHDGTSQYSADVNLKNDLYSIQRWQQLLTQSDPLSTLLGSLAVDQHAQCFGHVAITIVPLSPKIQKIHRKAFHQLQQEIFLRHEFLAILFEWSSRSSSWFGRIFAWVINGVARSPRKDEMSLTVGSTRHHDRETDVQSASNKLNSACFQVQIRIRVFGPEEKPQLASSLVRQIFAPLAQFNAPRLGLFSLSAVSLKTPKRRPQFLLSCSELSSIFHPPVQKTERLSTSRFIQLEPPKDLPLRNTNKQLMQLGQTCFHNARNIFGLQDKDAALHGFVVGSSGSGKTTLLTNAILSLIKRGQGITLVDFHGDFAKSIDAAIPNCERSRIVEFSPLSDSPIAFNPLTCPDKTYWPIVTDSVVAGMKNLFGHSWGPRLEQILQMALSAAIEAGDTTLVDVRSMLTDEPHRMRILTRVTDPIVRQFWLQTFSSWGKRLQIEATQSVINKLDALLTPKLRAILCQTGKSFDFRNAFDQRKIVIVNLARGQMGQTAASTLGSLVLSAIQNAALSRAELPEEQRLPHFVFLDELQLYSNPQAMTSLLAEARKYRVAVWGATQSLSSVDRDEVLPIILSNAANFIAFRVSQNDAVEIAPMLDDAIRPQDIVSLPRFHAYARVMVNGEVQSPFSFTTTVPRSGKQRS